MTQSYKVLSNLKLGGELYEKGAVIEGEDEAFAGLVLDKVLVPVGQEEAATPPKASKPSNTWGPSDKTDASAPTKPNTAHAVKGKLVPLRPYKAPAKAAKVDDLSKGL